ncbi:ThiF family adenylyltransferase [Micromonospora auratinigra]|uniref:Molybdopterin or thiamine biosynthesis adenylyltransferase n=1 Tax=Micromonospora auratinigra TaxID=261654 RepID=A0A1A9A489_9ACTN|nr:ThiF family adenylyltransferase [Micromonospora auratinigra]SBT51027.1 Molybdopterin or thiamine biosynthesis adenylyltransferase [Micromonospora auratinigra]
MRPVLKDVVCDRVGTELRLSLDRREDLLVEDPDGTVEKLLTLLREGTRTVPELAAALGLPAEDVGDALAALDSYRLVEDAERRGRFGAEERERYFSNLAFFELFATLERGREDFQRRLRDAHVLVLGTGGLNSTTVPHLCGLGIGRLTLLDRDEVEIRNFARQFLYRRADLGARKVARAAAWVRAFDPAVEVDHVDAAIGGPQDVADLLDRYRPDVVMSGVDQPVDIDGWVNTACVAAKVPLVRAGMLESQGVVWSVDPGVSACWRCALDPVERAAPAEPVAVANRAIGPVVGVLGSLAAFEVLRYLTRFEPPAYAGRPALVDFAAGCATTQAEWTLDPDCPVCAGHRTSGDTAEPELPSSA